MRKSGEKFVYTIIIILIIFLILNTGIILTRLPPPLQIHNFKTPTAKEVNFESILLNNNEFINEIQKLSTKQFEFYQKNCPSSDVFRPLTKECRNYTQSSETYLSYLALNKLFEKNQINPEDQTDHDEIFSAVPATFTQNKGTEIGRIAEFVIAPLISTYYITHNQIYLDKAISLSQDLLTFISPSKPIPDPFIHCRRRQHFDQNQVFIEDVSCVFPVLASIAHLTNNQDFYTAVQDFVTFIRQSLLDASNPSNFDKNQIRQLKETELLGTARIPILFSLSNPIGVSTSLLDFPFRLYADLSRISRILPSIQTDDLTKIGSDTLNKENPTKVFDLNYIKIISIEPCWYSSIMSTDDPLYPILIKKCKNLVKRKSIPSRMNGNSEFGAFDLLTQFEFDGEILELLWKNNMVRDAKDLIMKTIHECTYDGYITGLRNTTTDGKRSDNFLHPQFFSRWLFNAVLIEAGVKYDNIVLSENGNILKM